MKMKVGDLVHLSPIHFYEFDECLGIIIELNKSGEDRLFRVVWTDNKNGAECGWFHEEELEVINANR